MYIKNWGTPKALVNKIEINKRTHMIGTFKTGFLARAKGKERGMVAADIVKAVEASICISTHHILYIS
jgi:hypothetical protein